MDYLAFNCIENLFINSVSFVLAKILIFFSGEDDFVTDDYFSRIGDFLKSIKNEFVFIGDDFSKIDSFLTILLLFFARGD